jgi:hypothetical protein
MFSAVIVTTADSKTHLGKTESVLTTATVISFQVRDVARNLLCQRHPLRLRCVSNAQFD